MIQILPQTGRMFFYWGRLFTRLASDQPEWAADREI
jgi:hypothetical protein